MTEPDSIAPVRGLPHLMALEVMINGRGFQACFSLSVFACTSFRYKPKRLTLHYSRAYATHWFRPIEGALEVNLIGSFLTNTNPNVDKKNMHEFDGQALVSW